MAFIEIELDLSVIALRLIATSSCRLESVVIKSKPFLRV